MAAERGGAGHLRPALPALSARVTVPLTDGPPWRGRWPLTRDTGKSRAGPGRSGSPTPAEGCSTHPADVRRSPLECRTARTRRARRRLAVLAILREAQSDEPRVNQSHGGPRPLRPCAMPVRLQDSPGCRSHIESSRGTLMRECHHVVGDGDLLTIGLREHGPCRVEAFTVHQSAQRQDGLSPVMTPAHPGALQTLRDQAFAGRLDQPMTMPTERVPG